MSFLNSYLGIHALAQSVVHDIESSTIPQGTVNIVVPHHDLSFQLSMKFGQSLMQLAKDDEQGKLLLGEYLECSCGGRVDICFMVFICFYEY